METSHFDIKILKQSDYLIGMRLHSIIFATQLGKPFIALNYASKVYNYLEDLGLREYVVEIDSYGGLDKKITNLKKNSDEISTILLSKTEQFNQEIHTCVDSIFETYIV